MVKKLSHSFNLRLSPAITDRLKDRQNKLSEKFDERRLYDTSPHLSIANKFMDAATTPQFIKALDKEFEADSVWKLEFADFRPAPTNDYIFLHLSNVSREKLFALHERAFLVTKGIGLEIPSGNKFRYFPYDPHVSLIRLDPQNMPGALQFLRQDLKGERMAVTQYVITRQTDDENGFSNFPEIHKINLN
ncbi:MAG: hypothetical protein HY506_00045 [Candidatus Yanofskybacteria bacterium]|nr:hypothetical protein [Candidatus Yanofskybacteria bacterium]